MEDKTPKRIYVTVSPEEYVRIKVDAGLIPMSTFVKGRIFNVESQALKDTSVKDWVELLMNVDNRDELYEKLKLDAVGLGVDIVQLFKTRIR